MPRYDEIGDIEEMDDTRLAKAWSGLSEADAQQEIDDLNRRIANGEFDCAETAQERFLRKVREDDNYSLPPKTPAQIMRELDEQERQERFFVAPRKNFRFE